MYNMFGFLNNLLSVKKEDTDEQPQTPLRNGSAAFQFTVADAFSVERRGLVVVGTVDFGAVAVGQTVILSSSPEMPVVKGIEKNGQTTDEAKAGEEVALLFSDVTKEQVPRGAVITTN